MKYIKFKIGNKELGIELSDNYEVESTLINKVGPLTSNVKHPKLVDGLINYRGKLVDVVDISSLYEQECLKKFDGLLFITTKEQSIALKYEGFYEEVTYYSGDIIDIENILIQLKGES